MRSRRRRLLKRKERSERFLSSSIAIVVSCFSFVAFLSSKSDLIMIQSFSFPRLALLGARRTFSAFDFQFLLCYKASFICTTSSIRCCSGPDIKEPQPRIGLLPFFFFPLSLLRRKIDKFLVDEVTLLSYCSHLNMLIVTLSFYF